MNNGLLLVLVTAVGFGSWPIVGRVNHAYQFCLVALFMTPGVAIMSGVYAYSMTGLLHKYAMIWMGVSCIINGVSHLFILGEETNSKKIDIACVCAASWILSP